MTAYAALSDLVRLRIVDHLELGDASPSELQTLVGCTSNLLAHHLGVLERASLVTRHRSEADRRRTYLQLVPGVLDGLQRREVVPVSRVVFVCTANSARSQLAAALWAGASQVPVTSAGTHPAAKVAPGAARTARKHGLRLTQPAPQQVADVRTATDFVIAVCDNAYEALGRDTVQVHWSVPDPVRVGTAAAFDSAHDDLATRVARLAPRLTHVAS
ncbi:MAG: helix-turn-helix domain-containing protein [Nocardioides sp.]